ncbi:MAG: hypothetical protein KA956_07430 [Pyrinomonadaceae bacterium]|nr:hypothetical protein [Pyrinomonadaceae bacterium]
MIYHVLPGDAVAEEFKKTKIRGEVIVCRECLAVGDVDADILPDFWEQRARFILSEYGEDEIVYHETVADELAVLLDLGSDDEVNLWFEYELFCSVNMWFCLWLLSETGAAVFRVEPVVLKPEDRWDGFGNLGSVDLQKCYGRRVRFTPKEIQLGADLWNAFRKNDHERLIELSKAEQGRFPYLAEVCDAAIERVTRPAEIVAEIQFEGKTEFEEIFAEFKRRAGVYGYGDLQVQRIIDGSS